MADASWAIVSENRQHCAPLVSLARELVRSASDCGVARRAPGGPPRLSPALTPGQRRRKRRLDLTTAQLGNGSGHRIQVTGSGHRRQCITRGMLPRCTAATCINSTTDSDGRADLHWNFAPFRSTNRSTPEAFSRHCASRSPYPGRALQGLRLTSVSDVTACRLVWLKLLVRHTWTSGQ